MSTGSTLTRVKQEAQETIEHLKTERDELYLKSHLFKLELRDEWDSVEKKWSQLESWFNQLNHNTEVSANEIGASFRQLGSDIATAYQRIRHQTK